MSSEVLTQALVAGQTATFPRGRIFNILSSSAPLTVIADRRAVQGGQTQRRIFTNIPAGTKFTADRGDEWTYLQVTSGVNQNVSIFVGDEELAFNQAVSITGTANVQVLPSVAVADVADTAQASGTQTNIAANPARRRITIGCPIASANPVRVSGSGGAGKGIQIQPGTFVEFDTTAALFVRNDTAGAATWYSFEET